MAICFCCVLVFVIKWKEIIMWFDEVILDDLDEELDNG
tara:strand:+ start:15478 stop:15591 length:114 start_codon:yes stop_codon:yes gene_type:complete